MPHDDDDARLMAIFQHHAGKPVQSANILDFTGAKDRWWEVALTTGVIRCA